MKELLQKIVKEVKKREDFQKTLNNGRASEENWEHSYNAFYHDSKLIVLSIYNDNISYERQFLVFNENDNTLRDATENEDEELRSIDEVSPFLERNDLVFIIQRNHNDTITHYYDD